MEETERKNQGKNEALPNLLVMRVRDLFEGEGLQP